MEMMLKFFGCRLEEITSLGGRVYRPMETMKLPLHLLQAETLALRS
jgi:hypothetical protein